MQICLWRPGWKLNDVIDFGDKDPRACPGDH